MAKVKSKKLRIKSLFSDAFLIFGFLSITAGLYTINLSAALLGAGAMLIFAGVPKKAKPIIYSSALPPQKQIQPRRS